MIIHLNVGSTLLALGVLVFGAQDGFACGGVRNLYASASACPKTDAVERRFSLYTKQPVKLDPPTPVNFPIVLPSPGAPEVSVDITSENNSLSEFGPDMPAKLRLRCRGGNTNIAVQFPGHPVARDSKARMVSVRFDGRPPVPVEFRAGKGYFVIGLWQHNQAKAFLTELENSSSLILETLSEENMALSAKFDLTLKQPEILAIRQSCPA